MLCDMSIVLYRMREEKIIYLLSKDRRKHSHERKITRQKSIISRGVLENHVKLGSASRTLKYMDTVWTDGRTGKFKSIQKPIQICLI